MKRYNVFSKGMLSELRPEEQPDGPFYLAADVDARIAELERIAAQRDADVADAYDKGQKSIIDGQRSL